MARPADTEWITEGAAVAEYSGDTLFGHITFTTISELSPLWIVLDNGNRYYRTTLRAYGVEDDGPELMSAGDQRVRDALAVKILAQVIAGLHNVEHTVTALTADNVVAVLTHIERVVGEAKAAITAEDIMDTARAAEGNQHNG